MGATVTCFQKGRLRGEGFQMPPEEINYWEIYDTVVRLTIMKAGREGRLEEEEKRKEKTTLFDYLCKL